MNASSGVSSEGSIGAGSGTFAVSHALDSGSATSSSSASSLSSSSSLISLPVLSHSASARRARSLSEHQRRQPAETFGAALPPAAVMFRMAATSTSWSGSADVALRSQSQTLSVETPWAARSCSTEDSSNATNGGNTIASPVSASTAMAEASRHPSLSAASCIGNGQGDTSILQWPGGASAMAAATSHRPHAKPKMPLQTWMMRLKLGRSCSRRRHSRIARSKGQDRCWQSGDALTVASSTRIPPACSCSAARQAMKHLGG
mmetsp:Transcript_83277/g.235962  ORF Transcript_83277/g.235962 Transcript_83277/m.235962 type:complete len:261 (+) Transcript_83277:714-1496(+)